MFISKGYELMAFIFKEHYPIVWFYGEIMAVIAITKVNAHL